MTTELVTTSAPLATIKAFDTSILTGQVRQSTISMYKRDFAAYVAFAACSSISKCGLPSASKTLRQP